MLIVAFAIGMIVGAFVMLVGLLAWGFSAMDPKR